MPAYQITWQEAMKFKEKVLFDLKKKAGKPKQWIYPITLVEFDPLKKLKKKFSRLEKRFEKAEKKKPLLAKRLMRSAMSTQRKMDKLRTQLVMV